MTPSIPSRRGGSFELDISDPATGLVPEIGDILATGLMRLAARKSSQIAAQVPESSLDNSPPKSSDPTRDRREKRK